METLLKKGLAELGLDCSGTPPLLRYGELLLETNKSITDIAFECGFNDSNYFGDSFRKIKGISPRKYRKNETF